jgi:uncharacterized protein YodC (DUF2158 family)
MSEIKKGDRVILKSGGPVMTVQNIGDYSESAGIKDGALCAWFDEKTPKEKVFDLAALQKA